MKKKYFFNLGVGIIALCLIVGVIISVAHFQKQTIDNLINPQQKSQNQEKQEQQTQQEEVKETEEADDAVLLRTMLAPNEADHRMEGWFSDLLKEKLNIEIDIVTYEMTYSDEYEEEFKKGIDLYYFHGSLGYYKQIKKGKLRNLEPYIKKHPKIYSRYSNAIQYVKKDTYKHTGKKGVYGFPAWLKSFDDRGKDYVNYCISVPVSAKHPKEAMKLLTWSASDEGIMNIAYGPEEQMWKKEKGKYVLIKDWHDEDPGKKIVDAKYGKEDFQTAVCPLYLVGNQMLADKLIK